MRVPDVKALGAKPFSVLVALFIQDIPEQHLRAMLGKNSPVRRTLPPRTPGYERDTARHPPVAHWVPPASAWQAISISMSGFARAVTTTSTLAG